MNVKVVGLFLETIASLIGWWFDKWTLPVVLSSVLKDDMKCDTNSIRVWFGEIGTVAVKL